MKKFRIGVFGTRRGMDIGYNLYSLGCELVAVCDFLEDSLTRTRELVKREKLNTVICNDFDEFIKQDMDAVVLGNYFHEHAPYAIRCFEKGIHVISECISNSTMAEGVELLRAFKKSNSIYMLAENYPQMVFNREMKRIKDTGTLGKITYAEGEYNHPTDPYDIGFTKCFKYKVDHWRHYTPSTYYITHSLGPCMWITGATPKRVSAYSIFCPETDPNAPIAGMVGDNTSIITTQNDDGSIFRVTGCAKFGGHHNSYRICGTKGSVENFRGTDDEIMLRYNSWSSPDGTEINHYKAEWNDPDEERARNAGHGGADFFTARYFLRCLESGKQPEHPFDIRSAIAMSSVGILAHRSVLNGNIPYDIPDFDREEDCRLYENDRLSPFPGPDGSAPTIPCCSHPDFRPLDSQLEAYAKLFS
ncbi:MAG: Gfo/Idh/MocA family oxidoreductase [Clostridia bacterium]|nr:Gfo/Idh/MocA family oxidoreductase [Clostridia bacterium]